ncbi:unnamed protein product [Closterium sp. NIES-54]
MVAMKRRAISSTVIDFLQAAKCAIFVSRSTTTRIASFPLAPAGNPVTKSIVTCYQACSGGGIGCNCLAGRFRDDFVIWQARSPGGAVSGSNPDACTCRPLPLRVLLGSYGRTNPLHKQALLSQWSSGWDPNISGQSLQLLPCFFYFEMS